MVVKVNKINSRNIFSLYHRLLPLYNNRDVVQDRVGIMNATLNAVNRSDLVADYADGLQREANYTERRGTTMSTGTGHSQLGDSGGGFMHDPWDGGIDRNNPSTVNTRGSIFFRARTDE